MAGFLLLILAALPACRSASKPTNFILVTLDTQRADFVGAYSTSRAKTPALDSLAARGVLFENAWSLIPITLPAHASMLFSNPPHAVKSYNNGQIIRAARSHPSVVNLFRKEGFLAAAFVSLGVLGSKYGLSEGFQEYYDTFPADRWYLSAGEVNERVLPWLKANKDRKFFLWIHYSDPHDPYAPPETPDDLKLYLNDRLLGEYSLAKYLTYSVDLPLQKGGNQLRFEVTNPYKDNPDQFLGRLDRLILTPEPDQKEVVTAHSRGWFIRRNDGVFFFKNQSTLDIKSPSARTIKFTFRGKLMIPVEFIRELYKKEVEYMDSEIGRLWETLEKLGLFETTAILVAGDHGEGLGEFQNLFHDPHIGHIHFLNAVYTKVPLILYRPGFSRPGERQKAAVSLLDVAPTIAGAMGFKKLPSFLGRDLTRLQKEEDSSIFQETFKPEAIYDRFALIRGPWHLIYCPEENKYQLFNLADDPEEKTDLFGGQGLPKEALLQPDLNAFARDVLKGKEEVAIDSKTEEMLRALGYIKGPGAGSKSSPDSSRDPEKQPVDKPKK